MQGVADAAASEDPADDPTVVVPLDLTNAFQNAFRSEMLAGLELFCPEAAGLAAAEWSSPTVAWLSQADGSYASCSLERGGWQ
eukprot:9141131-Karenia_brevis.AAC.1